MKGNPVSEEICDTGKIVDVDATGEDLVLSLFELLEQELCITLMHRLRYGVQHATKPHFEVARHIALDVNREYDMTALEIFSVIDERSPLSRSPKATRLSHTRRRHRYNERI